MNVDGPATCPDVTGLISRDRIHGRLYYDRDIFDEELKQIWGKAWLYLGHESEIPAQGDYVCRQVGQQPLLMVRGSDLKLRVFYNRCRHRANLISSHDRDHASEFLCPYHGWTYSIDGALTAPSFGKAYGSALRGEDLALTPVERLDSYRGLIFVSFTHQGIGLEEHLGKTKALLDFVIDRSPQGEVMLTAGMQSAHYQGNWKMLPENSIENYHGPFVHRVAFGLSDRRAGRARAPLSQRLPDQEDETLYLGGGHMAEFLPRQPNPVQKPPTPARVAYLEAMKSAYGDARAKQLTETLPAFFFIFPNLMFIQTHFRRLEPVSVDRTNVYYHPVLLKGVPEEINRDILRFHETSFGPAGFVTPDDIQIMEHNQRALHAQGNEWLYLARGVERETPLAGGGSSAQFMDENQLRGMWHHYAELMSGQ